ncbi:MAG: hypothetical protein WDO56_14215 [Gammaproteobacteria bacterium]
MSYVVCVLLALALWHWLYESVLAPSFRRVLRLELIALQAELAGFEVRPGDSCGSRVLHALADSLMTLNLVLHRLDVVTLTAVEFEIRRNPALRELAESRTMMFQSCGVDALRDLRRRSLRLAARAVAVNSGAWCIFVVPAALALLGARGIGRTLVASLLLSKSDLSRIASNLSPAV